MSIKNMLDKYRNSIVLGNSISVLKELPNTCIDLVITSPPYDNIRDYEGKVIWNFEVFKLIAKELYRVLKEGAVVVWVVGDATIKGNKTLTSYKQALYFQEIGFNIYDVMIYEKAGGSPPHKNRYVNTFEYMFIISKGKPKTVNLIADRENKWAGYNTYGESSNRSSDGSLTKRNKRVINAFSTRTNIWRYTVGYTHSTQDKIAFKHPAIFPEQLAYDHLVSWSNKGDIVLDPFGGSGTTAKVCYNNFRDFIHIDCVESYCDIAYNRLMSYCPIVKYIKESDKVD